MSLKLLILIFTFVELFVSVITMPRLSSFTIANARHLPATVLNQTTNHIDLISKQQSIKKEMKNNTKLSFMNRTLDNETVKSSNISLLDEMDGGVSESVLHKVTFKSQPTLVDTSKKMIREGNGEQKKRMNHGEQVKNNLKYSIIENSVIHKQPADNTSSRSKLKLYSYKNKLYPIKLITRVIKQAQDRENQSKGVNTNNISAEASYTHEDWVNYPVESEAPSTTTVSNSDISATDSATNEVVGDQQQQQQQQQQQMVSKEASSAEQQVTPQKGSASATSEPDRVHVRKESSSKHVEQPVVSKSSTTTTTIGDGKKKAKLVTKSAALPPGLRQRIIEEFVRKGGNPHNIVVSDSTITTTSQSKKKTITTVYKVVPITKGRRKNNIKPKIPKIRLIKTNMKQLVSPRIPISAPIMKPLRFDGGFTGDLGVNNMKVANLKPRRFKKVTFTQTVLPKNMFTPIIKPKVRYPASVISDSGDDDSDSDDDFDDTPHDGGLTIQGPTDYQQDKENDEYENPVSGKGGEEDGLERQKVMKLQMVPLVDQSVNVEDDGAPISTHHGRQVKGVGGGGISLNTLMDAIKQMQQLQLSVSDGLSGKHQSQQFKISSFLKQPHESKSSSGDDSLSLMNGNNKNDHSGKHHLSNFNDFNQRPAKKASDNPTIQPQSQVTEEPHGGGNEEQEKQSVGELSIRQEQRTGSPSSTGSNSGSKIGENNSAEGGAQQTTEERLEEFKRAVIASTERLKERRSKVLAAATVKELEQEKSSVDSSRSGGNVDGEKRRFPLLNNHQQSGSNKENESSSSLSKDSLKESGDKLSKTHNIMMLIDFNPPQKSTTPAPFSDQINTRNQNNLKMNNFEQQGYERVRGTMRAFHQPAQQLENWLENDNNQWRPLRASTHHHERTDDHLRLHELQPHMSVSVSDGLIDGSRILDSPHRVVEAAQVSEVVGPPDYGESGADEAAAAVAADQQNHRFQQQAAQMEFVHGPEPSSSIDPSVSLDQGEMFYDTPAASQRYQYRIPMPSLYQHLSQLSHFIPHGASSIPSTLLGLFQHHLRGSGSGSYGGVNLANTGGQHSELESAQESTILPEESARTNQLVNRVIDELVMSASSGGTGRVFSTANMTNQVVYHQHPADNQPATVSATAATAAAAAAATDDDDADELANEETNSHLSLATPTNPNSNSSSSSSSTSSSLPISSTKSHNVHRSERETEVKQV